jgi:hypothetical protein
MNITYTVPSFDANARSTTVRFTDEEGKIFERGINIPKANGEIDQAQWEIILEQHLTSVKYKRELGVIQFTTPVDVANSNTSNTTTGN